MLILKTIYLYIYITKINEVFHYISNFLAYRCISIEWFEVLGCHFSISELAICCGWQDTWNSQVLFFASKKYFWFDIFCQHANVCKMKVFKEMNTYLVWHNIYMFWSMLWTNGCQKWYIQNINSINVIFFYNKKSRWHKI